MRAAVVVFVLLLTVAVRAETAPPLPSLATRASLAEALHLLSREADHVWPGWKVEGVPILLVTDDGEYLLGTASAPSGYARCAPDVLLGRLVWGQSRHTTEILVQGVQTMAGEPTVCISSKEVFERLFRTSPLFKNAEDYVLAFARAAFQAFLASSTPGSQQKRAALGLDGKASYPYSDEVNQELLGVEARLLGDALQGKDRRARLRDFLEVRALRRQRLARRFGDMAVRIEMWREWQEGLAAYAEVALAERAASPGYRPTEAVARVENFNGYRGTDRGLARHLSLLQSTGSPVVHREFGRVEGRLLDALAPGWKKQILEEGSFADDLLAQAVGMPAVSASWMPSASPASPSPSPSPQAPPTPSR